ncbi:YSIRK-type signal peptide-containing protein [Gemella haemolysans]|uniref:Gram-positive signal peptide protein, YSIRK family n=1 Tax=Gemella haemolysans ATCC 10379 TaxID=546270 RepID=C5NXP0_9BACL|nr:YSIRK-type signal peptide-containing protein [Gemella haemolysans]EER68009.1 Gram-positive signal peptide protein, YSIRK family [Gemella haemolysans ATCC 10379]KAA8708817.1 YSIRK-type signal peptide-containing protein [Gemella haemolysans]UBH82754.1 YSIRK-type signal peptide-containing protein [Gemella haemolysans]VEI38985.1 Beta antigen [Gemella haemolysans]
MFSTRKYSIRKVSVGIASVLIGIVAGSLGTAYAHEDTNNVVVTAESNHDVNLEHVNKPVLEEVEKPMPKPELAPKPVEPMAPPVCEDCKHEENIVEPKRESHLVNVVDKPALEKVENPIPVPEVVSKPEKKNESVTPVTGANKADNLFKSVLEDKIDWNTIDEKEFVNYLFADIKVDKKKEQEIKEVWLIKVNELLAVEPNNINLQKVKAILENSLKSNSLVEIEKPKEEKVTEDKKENKESEKDETKKVTPKEEKITEDKKEKNESEKDETKKAASKEEKVTETKKENKEPAKAEDKKENKESIKETDKKEVPKGQTVPENKQEVPSKETPKITSDKTDSSNNKKQETSENNAPVKNKVLSATLSGRDVAVSFDKNKIKADDVFVGAINDEKLNKTIIEKLGSEYKVIEVFEIHFKKDGKKIDSDAERTVKVSVVKNDNAELEVYHIADNNILEKVESSFSDSSLQFKINHFSKFTILERIRVGAKDLESRVQIVTPVKAEYKAENKKEDSDNSNKVNNDKKEELPKTGLESEKTTSIALLALGTAIAIRRKQKQ